MKAILWMESQAAEIVRGHPHEHPEGETHGGVPAGRNHVMVVLFDEKSGERIVGARSPPESAVDATRTLRSASSR